MGQGLASNFDLPVALGLQLADRALKIILNKLGVGADRLQRARDDHFGWFRHAAAKASAFRLMWPQVHHRWRDVSHLRLDDPVWLTLLRKARERRVASIVKAITRDLAGMLFGLTVVAYPMRAGVAAAAPEGEPVVSPASLTSLTSR